MIAKVWSEITCPECGANIKHYYIPPLGSRLESAGEGEAEEMPKDANDDLKCVEEPKIEPYYQSQAKQLVDSLFDLGLLSGSLSRDGIDGIEGLVALHFQQIADSTARCTGFQKKYKILGGRLKKDENDNRERHEEEMQWIQRGKDAEARAQDAEHKVFAQRSEILRLEEEIERLNGQERADAGHGARKLSSS